MNTPAYRTARALYPHRPELWEPEFLYEPLPIPQDHPELSLFSEGGDGSAAAPALADPPRVSSFVRPAFTDPIQARMLNEFVYCPRLFYYEFVDGVFVESADTERGSAIHKKVDKGKGELPPAKPRKPPTDNDDNAAMSAVSDAQSPPPTEGPQSPHEGAASADDSATRPRDTETDTLHSRSTSMGSERLGVVAKMDLIEVHVARDPEARQPALAAAPPVPAKRAKPRPAEEEPNLFSFTATPQAPYLEGAQPAPKLDARPELVEVVAPKGPREIQKVTPVEYKIGAPRAHEHGNEIWDADKMQLGLQILILRDNGYPCDEGVIYYRTTKQRVPLVMTPELEVWIIEQITAARLTAEGSIPPPLVNSPKCVRCSLAPVCLPDETHLLARTTASQTHGHRSPLDSKSPAAGRLTNDRAKILPPASPPRRLIAARDDSRALYLNTQGARVTLRSEVLVVKEQDSIVGEFRTQDVSHVSLFGNIQITTQVIQHLCEAEIPVAYFSMGGWFYGLTRGHGLKNVFTRIEQFQIAQDPHRCLALSQRIVHGKIRNHRTQIMRNHINLPEGVSLKLKRGAADALMARDLNELLGIEGAAAALYFQHFAGMIKVGADDDDLPGLEAPQKPGQPEFSFDFTKRKRRPPTDPVNALLSLAYSLLAKDCTLAALAVGFDPYIGFYHQPRFGRPALALDLMEEFRPLIAESAVLTALNNRMITPGHFVKAGEAVNLTTHGRKAFFQAYEQRMNSLVTHPVFDYKASYRRVLELQARMLARYLTGEISDYVPMMTR